GNGHPGLDMIQNGCAQEKAVWRSIIFYIAAISGNFGALSGAGLDQARDAVAMLARDEGAHIRLRLAVGRADFDGTGSIDERGQNTFGSVPNDDGCRSSHAAFT